MQIREMLNSFLWQEGRVGGWGGGRKDILAIFIMMEITVTVFSKPLEDVLRLSSNIWRSTTRSQLK